MPDANGNDLRSIARQAAAAAGVPEDLFVNQIQGESNFNPLARNSVGSGHVGIAQFDPATAARYGLDPTDPVQSLHGAARYMADLYKKTGSWDSALKSYVGATTNAGLQRVIAGNPSYAKAFELARADNSLLQQGGTNVLAPGLPAFRDIATRLAANPVNALAPKEVAASSATPPASVAGNLTPASPLANSVALMALAAAGTHRFVPVDYDPFKQLELEQNPTGTPAVAAALKLAGTVSLPTPQTGLAPVHYVTKTGMRSAYANPELNLATV